MKRSGEREEPYLVVVMRSWRRAHERLLLLVHNSGGCIYQLSRTRKHRCRQRIRQAEADLLAPGLKVRMGS